MAATRPGGGIQARLRGRLGAAAAAARATAAAAAGAGAGAATAAGRRALAAARGETARRLGRLAALTLVLAVLVMVLYDHGDVPTAAARGASGPAAGQAGPAVAPGVPGAGPGGAAAAPGGATAGRKTPGDASRSVAAQGRPGGRADAGTAGRRAAPGAAGARPLQQPAKPAEVAAAWYAARHGLPRSRVRPLQQDRIAAGQVRVLVLAEASHGRLRTALVRVRRGPSGWEVG